MILIESHTIGLYRSCCCTFRESDQSSSMQFDFRCYLCCQGSNGVAESINHHPMGGAALHGCADRGHLGVLWVGHSVSRIERD